MKEAILVVSFGTTHLDTLEKTICAIESDAANAYPGIPCRRAFTSRIIRRRLLSQYGMEVLSVADALHRLEEEGFTRVTLQPTLLIPGEEFDRIREDVLRASGEMSVTVGLPLLWDDSDLETMVDALQEAYPLPEDTVLLAVGHGTSHAADGLYIRLQKHMRRRGMDLCTVEGSVDFDSAVNTLLEGTRRKIHLVPLLIVAGDHAKNDIAGTEPDSLRSRLEEAGFTVSYSLQGLGEIPAVRKAILSRLAAARASCKQA